VEVPGAGLFAQADGDGPPIVLLHAGIVDSRVWEPFVPLLTVEGFRVIWYDARGYGRSATDDVAFNNVDDLLAVLDAFDVRAACLVGNSRGGMIAFDTAVTHPERVAGVVLLGAHISGFDPAVPEHEAAVDAQLEALEHAGDLEALVEFELQVWGGGVGQPPDRLPAGLRDFLRPLVEGAEDPRRVRGDAQPIEPPAADRLTAATMPVLVVAGDLDFSYVEATGRHLAATLPDATAVVVPGVAHMIAVEAPDETAALIVEHVRSLGRYDEDDEG
jgi:pimeloyl-ACP methyl ester carboxylesterase